MSGARGFPVAEYRARVARAQDLMAKAGLSALLLTTEPEVRYFTGFLTRFWESPARPWFVIVPASGDPIAVIPSIGAALMSQGWMRDIRTWTAPNYDDDGVSLVAEALREVVPKGERVGAPGGHETHLRMPLNDWARLQSMLADRVFSDDADVIRHLRLIKSELEVAKIETACGIADRAFDRVPDIARAGVPVEQVFRDFQRLLLEEGADWVSYLSGGAEQNGYGDVIAPAKPDPLRAGDVLMLDTGAVWDGYFCDFDRNYSVGAPSDAVATAHARMIEATAAAFEAARPGTTMADLFHVMNKILTGGAAVSDAGRIGHGLGMQLTEYPSIIPDDHTVIEAGMVLTLEPGIDVVGGGALVHEENIVITENGARWLSTPSGPAIREVSA